jgi:hypothetical protein
VGQQVRRQRRGERSLQPELAAWPGARAGWDAADEATRLLYLDYVGAPWAPGTRRALARDTAVWAANGELEMHIQHGGSKGSWLLGALAEALIDVFSGK